MADDSKDEKKQGALNGLVQAESMVQMALVLPAACCIGWFGGTALDGHFHTGWIGIAGFMLGAVAGFVQIFKMLFRTQKRRN